MKKIAISLLCLLAVAAAPLAAGAQVTSVASGSWTVGATWSGGVPPTSADDVLIAAGHTVSVDDAAATCHSLSFGGNNALIDMNANALLTVYGDVTLFSTTHIAFSAGWSATNCFIKFAGAEVQTLRGWSTTGGCTSFRDVIVDKSGGMVTTDGTGMRLGIQNSLDIVNGIFELAAQDDIEGRWASSGVFTSASLPNVTVRSGAEFTMVDGDGAHHIRSGYVSATATHVPIGKFTVYGKATFVDASTFKMTFSGVDVESGGKIITSVEMGGGEFDCGPVHIKPGGEMENYTTSDIWGPSATLTLDAGGLLDTKSTTTLFPASFVNNGTVRYSRDGTTDQLIVPMNYTNLEVSFDVDNAKILDLTGSVVVSDTLKVDNNATLQLTAAAPQVLTVGKVLYLTTGQVANNNANAVLSMADGAMIQRATGAIAAAPAFAGQVDLRYSSTAAAVTTGPEVPAAAGVLRNFILSGDQGVTLGSDLLVGGTCTISGSDLVTGAHAVTLGSGATLAESAGMTVLGTVQATRTVAQAAPEAFGGIGLDLTAAGAAPGVTTVTRTTGVAQDVNGTSGIERSFAVAAANNAGLDATVVFHYDESELAGTPESSLSAFTAPAAGTTWTKVPGALDDAANTMTVPALPTLARMTLRAGYVSAVDGDVVAARTGFVSLYPNPFNPATHVTFDLAKTGPVEVAIYDVRGQLVQRLATGTMTGGRHDLVWQGRDDAGRSVASGVYFCRLSADGLEQSRKLILAR